MTPAHPTGGRWLAHAVCAALGAAARLNIVGLLLGALTLLGLARLPHSPMVWIASTASLVGTLAEAWLMVRIAIDQRLFAALAGPGAAYPQDDDGETQTLAALDDALLTLGWLTPARRGRPLAERARATLRFLRWAALDALLRLLCLAALLLGQAATLR